MPTSGPFSTSRIRNHKLHALADLACVHIGRLRSERHWNEANPRDHAEIQRSPKLNGIDPRCSNPGEGRVRARDRQRVCQGLNQTESRIHGRLIEIVQIRRGIYPQQPVESYQSPRCQPFIAIRLRGRDGPRR